MLEKRFPHICDKVGASLFLEIKNDLLKKLEGELKAYFDGNLKKFTIPIKTLGTDYQQSVWEKLQELPYGSTTTYGHEAKMMGCPANHARAIGNACANNVQLILIPCHRVLASKYKGGYNSREECKEWLINHENKYN